MRLIGGMAFLLFFALGGREMGMTMEWWGGGWLGWDAGVREEGNGDGNGRRWIC